MMACQPPLEPPIDFPEGESPLGPLPSQSFTVNTAEETVVEGAGGTTLFIRPGTWVDGRGRRIEAGEVELKLIEAYTVADRIRLGATQKTVDGQMLVGEGMFYLEATYQGEPAYINPKQPLYVELHTGERSGNMHLYEGKWTEEGLVWTNPKQLPNYLITYPFEELPYLPAVFDDLVAMSLFALPGHDTLSPTLLDSLFLSLTEPFSRDDFYVYSTDATQLGCVDPTAVMAFRNQRLEGSYLATPEFSERLLALYTYGNMEMLQIYLDHVEDDLWVADSLAALLWDSCWVKTDERFIREVEYFQRSAFGDPYDDIILPYLPPVAPEENPFMKFSRQRLGNTKNPPHANMVRRYHQRKRAQLRAAIDRARAAYQALLDQEDAEREATKAAYRELLNRRHREHVEEALHRGGVLVENTGWQMVGALAQTHGLTAEGMSLDSLDRYHLYAFQQEWGHLFEGYQQEEDVWYFNVPNLEPGYRIFDIYFIAVGYLGEQVYYGDSYVSEGANHLSLDFDLKAISREVLARELAKFEPATEAQDIVVDLAFQQKMWEQEELRRLRNFQRNLHNVLYSTLCNCNLVGAELEEGF